MKHLKLIQCLIFVILCVIIYGVSLGNGFIWDDEDYLYENRWVQRMDGLKTIWFSQETRQYYPLTYTSFWFEHKIWGLNPFGYHVVNLILHILNAILVFLITIKLNARLAFPVALLFAIHPIQVETVAWISERKNLLALFFFLLAVLAYLQFECTQKPKHYLKTIMLFMCAVLSKSIAVCFAFLPVVYNWWRRGRITRRDVCLFVTFAGIGILGAINTVHHELYRVGARGSIWDATFLERFVRAGRILLFYIYKLCLPLEFMFFYPRWVVDIGQWWQWLFPFASMILVIFLFYYRQRIGRGASALFLFYIISIFPALGFINVYPMKFSFVADHFMYLSTPCLLLFLCSSTHFLLKKIENKKKFQKRVSYKIAKWSFFLFITAYLSVKSMVLTLSYTDRFTFWEDLIRKNPNVSLAYNNLGYLYNSVGNYIAAMPLLEKAIEIEPDNVMAYNNLGIAYDNVGDSEKAIALYEKIIALKSDNVIAYNNLAATYSKLGKPEQAISLLRTALEINPDSAVAHNNLAKLYYYDRRYKLAIWHCRKALELGYSVEPGFLEVIRDCE